MRYELHIKRPSGADLRLPIYVLEILHIASIMVRAVIGLLLGSPYDCPGERGDHA
jgi:hypothetical protein